MVEAIVADIVNRYGHIDVLVNNAGIAEQSLFTDITDKQELVSPRTK